MLAIAGGKGGCGKTTTTLGLGGALVRQRKPALAVDADREMPDLHAMAGVARDPGLDAVAEGWSPELVAGTADAPVGGVAVVPAGSARPDRGPTASTRERPDTGRGPTDSTRGRREPFARLRRVDGPVLLDCPAGAGPDAVAPLRAADAVVLVTTPEPACLRDAAKTAAMARELGTPVAGAVVSRADEPPVGVGKLLGCPLLGAVPDASVAAGVRAGKDGVTRSTARPLADRRVRAAHDRLLSGLQPKYL